MKKIIIDRGVMKLLGCEDTIFRRGNISTFPVETAEEILEIHGIQRGDLIIAQESIPAMGGAGLCASLRKDIDLKNVSILIVTNGVADSVARWHAAGANAVVPKAFDPAQLFFKISELLVIPERKDLRVPLRASVTNERAEETFLAETRNISISGMLIETNHIFQEGDRLQCSFNIAHSKIDLQCRVARVPEQNPGGNLYGLSFVNPDMKTLIIIENYVKMQARRRPS